MKLKYENRVLIYNFLIILTACIGVFLIHPALVLCVLTFTIATWIKP